ncbi:dihydrofolate reductase family protein [Dysgonomonas sp. 520]|uniref:dihydrofolate reductase family protein n=1 Tax=Dysgonomonas sp. 520 TaxID=2302931 RepID=UPI0013D6E04C|nr:dihydrofolate reductase family protein [Dysgonomonas sp. 520]NDW08646.1 dihydrofolate reductase [Dysgonomonas sp. 520]
MKKLKLYITASNDGYIAPPDGDLDWLIGYPVPSKEDHKNFVDSVDTVIMGANTYRNMRIMDILWPYEDKNVHIVTRNPMMERDSINFITENVFETVSGLKKENGKDIWLVGGAELTTMLLDNDLIDEMIITYIPETLEKGISLFSQKPEEMGWVLSEDKIYENNAVRKAYQKTLQYA